LERPRPDGFGGAPDGAAGHMRSPLSRHTLLALGRSLVRVYQDVLERPVPARIQELVIKLEDHDGKRG
jgi:hypothetical protein